MVRKLGFLLVFIFGFHVQAEFPSESVRVKVFDRLVSEMERIDGEGLLPRENRPEPWHSTVRQLRSQIIAAKTPQEFGAVFRKLDATYPNLHARVVLADEYEPATYSKKPEIAVRFRAEIIKRHQRTFTYKISNINSEMMKEFKEHERPAIGDILLAINDRPLSQWSKENFIYCKFPHREQCENNIFDNFRKGLLSWKAFEPLQYTFLRNGREWKLKIPVQNPTPTTSEDNQSSDCPVESDRYEAFTTSYKGLNVCAFESPRFPGTVVLRIASFSYKGLGEGSKIKSIKDEVDKFYEYFWQDRAPKTKKLIIDLLDNGGGDTPVEWYRIFYSKPFQEMYVRFKKLIELDKPEVRGNLFYQDSAKEIWFSELLKSKRYSKIKIGDFLPPIPQFCAKEDKSCLKGLFEPRLHGFKGQVTMMTNEWCISSCSGFVWSMKKQLNAKIIGLPDSGDSAYARLFVDIYLDFKSQDGFRLEVSSRKARTNQKFPEGALLRQQVSATRSTDSKGKLLSGRPRYVDEWVAPVYRSYLGSWESQVFKAALKN